MHKTEEGTSCCQLTNMCWHCYYCSCLALSRVCHCHSVITSSNQYTCTTQW